MEKELKEAREEIKELQEMITMIFAESKYKEVTKTTIAAAKEDISNIRLSYYKSLGKPQPPKAWLS